MISISVCFGFNFNYNFVFLCYVIKVLQSNDFDFTKTICQERSCPMVRRTSDLLRLKVFFQGLEQDIYYVLVHFTYLEIGTSDCGVHYECCLQ